MAVNDPANIRLGACVVSYNGSLLGLTKGGVSVDIMTNTKTVEVDQFGNTAVNEYIIGRSVKVKIPVAETDVDSMFRLIGAAGATLTPGSAGVGKYISVTNGVGLSLRAAAKVLILHPHALPTIDKSEDITIPLAATAGTFSFAYKVDEERVYSLEFVGYPDLTSSLLFYYGDKTVA